jgi:RAD50-interacting protein 1
VRSWPCFSVTAQYFIWGPTNGRRCVVADRYRPLPSFSHRLPFLVDIQLPLLEAYHSRITSAVDAFETLSHGFVRAVAVPGTLGESSGGPLTTGVTGLQRLVRASVSSRWIEGVCRGWGEDVVCSFHDLWLSLLGGGRGGCHLFNGELFQ